MGCVGGGVDWGEGGCCWGDVWIVGGGWRDRVGIVELVCGRVEVRVGWLVDVVDRGDGGELWRVEDAWSEERVLWDRVGLGRRLWDRTGGWGRGEAMGDD